LYFAVLRLLLVLQLGLILLVGGLAMTCPDAGCPSSSFASIQAALCGVRTGMP
jgi:hypothetical protein